MSAFEEIDLKELSAIEAGERAVLSLYLANASELPALKPREERIRRLLAEEPVELEHFEESLQLLKKWLEENPPNGKSVCVFASFAGDMVKGFELPLPVRTTLRLAPAPYLRPIARMMSEHKDFLVVAADNDRTRLIRATVEGIDELKRVRGGVKNHVRVGGWSQKRYQRRRENELDHYAKDVVQAILAVVREEPVAWLVLLGSQETCLAIESVLPNELQQILVDRAAADLHAEDQSLVAIAQGLVDSEKEKAERELWHEIRERSLGAGLAALGPADVTAAMIEARVETLLVLEGAKIGAHQCRACGHVWAERRTRCVSCQSDDSYERDLVDELIRRAELTGAGVEFVQEAPELAGEGGVAAVLRY